MSRFVGRLCVAVLILWPAWSLAYVEAPYTLGRVVEESTHIVLVEVARINAEKKLIIYRKVENLKGEYPDEEIKHNIGERGFHEREWRTIMDWAEVGKRAVFFANADASETCIGHYWYQCYREEAWWGLQHGEPYMLRTYMGEIEPLAEAVRAILRKEEVVVPGLVNRNREQL
ncbi:MAG TPA: hypothetical protein VHB77_21270, partial [Planctomycetaceae bacterium]|nr:hypothetical protein [Planctomycetaceae bacterium]